VKAVAEVFDVAPEKPVEGLSLVGISGDAAKGIELRHVRQVLLRDINVTGISGPLVSIEDVTRMGLEGAAAYHAP
jgi:hypothetical protein